MKSVKKIQENDSIFFLNRLEKVHFSENDIRPGIFGPISYSPLETNPLLNQNYLASSASLLASRTLSSII